MIDLSKTENQLLVNPRISTEEQEELAALRAEFEKVYGTEGFFLVPSSGSSKKQDESVKLIALSRESIFNSAKRFNQYFTAQQSDSWGLVLPEFHVAGLGVKVRAHLAGAHVYTAEWNVNLLRDWVNSHQISFISMVPAQIYEIVQLKLRCMDSIKKVFVGAGALSADLSHQASELGWPIVETYGMTETCSMVAVREKSEHFLPLPGVSFQVKETLHIKCNSLLTASIQKKQGGLNLKKFDLDEWFVTEDRANVFQSVDGKSIQIELLGRQNEYVKILGEGVSLPELKEKLELILRETGCKAGAVVLLPLVDARRGTQLVLVGEGLGVEEVNRIKDRYNSVVRPYEKVLDVYCLESLPRTELGKLKVEELKSIILAKDN